MLEENDLVCPHCEKIIRYQRPNFCPFCGKEIDASVGLFDGSEVDIYPTSRIAPKMMYAFFAWLLVGLVVTYFFGRKGFVISSAIFVIVVLILFFGSWLDEFWRSKASK